MTPKVAETAARKLAVAIPALVMILGIGMLSESLIDMGRTAPASATPGEELRPLVAIDAGHGGEDGGAVGSGTGVVEAGLNLEYALALREELYKRGYDVVMTREDGEALGRGKRADMSARRELINSSEADILVSIHMNKFTDSSVRGSMAFYMEGSSEGEKLATCVIEAVCANTGQDKRLANPGDYYVLRESDMPAVIVECGFLSNKGDETLLQTKEHMTALVSGIADGVAEYFSTPVE